MMIQRKFYLVAAMAVALSDWAGGVTHAAWNSAFQTTCLFRRNQNTGTNYTSNYAPVTPVMAPAAAPCNNCNPCQSCNTQYVQKSFYEPVTTYERKSYYEPVTTYQTSYYYEPVTTYRYSCYYDPCSCSTKQVATPETSYRLRSQATPSTAYVEKVGYQPVTSYRAAFYYEPVTTCTTTTTTVGSPIYPPAQTAPVVAPAPCAPGVSASPPATAAPANPPGVSEQRITPSPTGSGSPSSFQGAPALGRMTGQNAPVTLSTPIPADNQPATAQPLVPTPARVAPPAAPRMDRLTSYGRDYTQVQGSLALAPANTRLVFIPANPNQGAEEARTRGNGQFDIRLQSGRYGVYAENSQGRPTFLQNVDLNGSVVNLALSR